MKTMGAAKFKANCLSVIAEVRDTNEPVTVTRHGKPVAMMVPITASEEDNPLASCLYQGEIVLPENVLASAIDPEDWNMLK